MQCLLDFYVARSLELHDRTAAFKMTVEAHGRYFGSLLRHVRTPGCGGHRSPYNHFHSILCRHFGRPPYKHADNVTRPDTPCYPCNLPHSSQPISFKASHGLLGSQAPARKSTSVFEWFPASSASDPPCDVHCHNRCSRVKPQVFAAMAAGV